MAAEAPLLSIENLSVAFRTAGPDGVPCENIAARNISLELRAGEMLALAGESGSGKSVTALSVLKLLPYPAASHPSGHIFFDGHDLLAASDAGLRKIRGGRIGMIFQEPLQSLNPLHSIFRQIAEAVLLHQQHLSREAVRARVAELLGLVGLEALTARLEALPHELSGGQRQRVMIAMALANNPALLIADEPTTALDVTVQAQILALIKSLQERMGMAVLLITHDLTIVRRLADRVAIMRRGAIVETGPVAKIFSAPQHSYTKHLLAAIPGGDPAPPPPDAPEILRAENITVHFPLKKNIFGRVRSVVRAVDGISLTLRAGHTLGVVGESGSGKSTLALALLRLIASRGAISFEGSSLDGLTRRDLRPLRRRMQIVFQDPYGSLNPRMPVADIIGEGLRAHCIGESPEARNAIIEQALRDVGLEPGMKQRYPHEFSGGQRQRIGVARALVLDPVLIALDEPTSALDASTQADILSMLRSLQEKRGLAYLFISHDLRVIRAVSHDVLVMKDGKPVEFGPRARIFSAPRHDYTKTLLSAAFIEEK